MRVSLVCYHPVFQLVSLITSHLVYLEHFLCKNTQAKVLIALFLFLFFLSNLTQKFQVIPEEYLKQLLTQYKRCRYNHPNVIKNIRAFWACPRNVPHKCFTNISKVSVFPSSSELPLLYVNVTFLWSYFQMSLSIYHAKNPLVLEIKFIIVYFQGMCKETSGMRLVNWLNYEN